MHNEDSKVPPTHYPGEERYGEISVRSTPADAAVNAFAYHSRPFHSSPWRSMAGSRRPCYAAKRRRRTKMDPYRTPRSTTRTKCTTKRPTTLQKRRTRATSLGLKSLRVSFVANEMCVCR